jgi:UDP-glucose 4-epimerase
MAKILVTGAAGFIGSHSVDRLLAQGHEVVGVDNLRTGHRHNLAAALTRDRFRLVEADITAPGFLTPLILHERPDAILHLAALVSVPESFAQPELNQRLNLEATRLVAEAATACETVTRIAFASSAAVYGTHPDLPLQESAPTHPISPDGAAQRASEDVLAACSRATPRIGTVALRYFNIYGPRQDPRSPYSGVISVLAGALREHRSPIIFGDGAQTRDFVAVADVARANEQALTRPMAGSIVVNICTGRAVSLNHLLQTMGAAFAFSPTPEYRPARAGDIRDSLGHPAQARQLLGFETALDLKSGVSALV